VGAKVYVGCAVRTCCAGEGGTMCMGTCGGGVRVLDVLGSRVWGHRRDEVEVAVAGRQPGPISGVPLQVVPLCTSPTPRSAAAACACIECNGDARRSVAEDLWG
jgi:hypothetical protein